MELPGPLRIAHVHKDQDAITVIFSNGQALVMPGIDLPEVVPDFVQVELRELKDCD